MSTPSAIHALLANANAALFAQPSRPSFDDTPEGKAFASLPDATRSALASIITEARQKWEAANVDDPDAERILAAAHILAGCASIGSAADAAKSRAFNLAGLINVTKGELGSALVVGDSAKLAPFAEVYARHKLATEENKVNFSEACRLAKLAPATKAMFGNLLAETPAYKVERVIPAKGNKPESKVELTVNEILTPLARKWASEQTPAFKLAPEPSAKK